MPELYTRLRLPASDWKINHSDKILFLGSCFSKNIGSRLMQSKFSTTINPLGIVYNPYSMQRQLELMSDFESIEKNIFQTNEVFFHYDFHSQCNGTSKIQCAENITTGLKQLKIGLKAEVLFVTLGTSWVYTLKDNERLVANCHKQPASLFERRILSITEIIDVLKRFIDTVKSFGPKKVVFTVSPIRHVKEGLIDNQRSKSLLLAAIHEVIEVTEDCFYFPSYELLMDEMRDYRFYTSDLLHPNELAIDRIWEVFCQTFFDTQTIQLVDKIAKINKSLLHRPFNPRSDAHQMFLSQTLQKIEALTKEENLDFTEEIKLLETQMFI